MVQLDAFQVGAFQAEPWLGNWLEFEGSLYQKHTQSSHVDTLHGSKQHFLHLEESVASLEFMPLENLSTAVELDMAKTQRQDFGFEAFRIGARYQLLDDLRDDPVALTLGITCALSTPSRVKDLSSPMHGVFESDVRVAVGREFGYTDTGYSNVWAMAKLGAASSGSPWAGGELHYNHAFSDSHLLDLFLSLEKGFSNRPLKHLDQFHSWSRINYQYEDLGIKYTYTEVAVGSFYIQLTKRLHARYCPKNSWSVELGFLISFSPW